nr:osteopetrosis associated transmembrane protein [Hymenolepis microstoma]
MFQIYFQPQSEIITFLLKTWRNAYCDQCLSKSSSNTYYPVEFYATTDTLPNYNLSAYNSDTLKFFDHLNAVVECIALYIQNSNVSFLDSVNFPTSSSIQANKSVCRSCLNEYSNLIQSYEVWINEVNGRKQRSFLLPLDINPFAYRRLCIDVVDAVNRSHFVWSNILECSSLPSQKAGSTLLPLIICVMVGVAFHAALICFFHRPSHVVVYMQSRVEATTEPVQPTTSNSMNTHTSHCPASSLLRKISFAPVARTISFDLLPQEDPLNH